MDNLKPPSTKSLLLFFVLTFCFSWFFWLFPVLASFGFFSLPVPTIVFAGIGAHGPLFAAVTLTFKTGGWAAVKQLIRSGFKLRMKTGWWFAIILTPIILTGIAVGLNVILNHYQPVLSLLKQPLMIVPTFLFLFFLGGSFQEEFGWRGYALPGLLVTLNPLFASLILGSIWGLWHLPLFFVTGISQSFIPFGIFLMIGILTSIVITFFYLRTNQNLFSALLFHTAYNTSLSLFQPIEQKIGGNQMALTFLMILYLCLTVLIIVIKPVEWIRHRSRL